MVVLSARNMYQIYLYTAPGDGSLWPKHAVYFVLLAPRNVIQLTFDIFINCNFEEDLQIMGVRRWRKQCEKGHNGRKSLNKAKTHSGL